MLGMNCGGNFGTAREQILNRLNPLLEQVVILADCPRRQLVRLRDEDVPNASGLYVIFHDRPSTILYVGKASTKGKSPSKSDGLRFRIMKNHLGKLGDDNFVRYIHKHFALASLQEAKSFIREQCSVTWLVVDDLQKLFLLEHFAIAALHPVLNRG